MSKKPTKLEIINDYDIPRLLDVLNNVKNGDIQKENEVRMLLDLKGVSIDTKPRKDGRWQGRASIDGVRVSFYGKSKEEVIIKMRMAVNGTRPVIKKKKPVKQEDTLHLWLDNWFKLYKTKLKPMTKVEVTNNINEIKAILPDKPLSQLKGIEIQEALEKVSTDYKRKRVYKRLHEALEKAQQLELIKRNPCIGVEPPKYVPKKKSALSLSEQTLLCEKLETHKYGPLLYLMLTTGLRIGEALALTKSDFTHDSVLVNKNVVFVKKQRIVQDTTKTAAGERTIFLPQTAYKKLLPLLAGEFDQIFFDQNSKYVSKVFSMICASLGLKGYSLHSLRHTYATRLSEAGVPPKVRQYLLGHANLSVTENTYTDTKSEFVNSQKSTVLRAFDSSFDTTLTPK